MDDFFGDGETFGELRGYRALVELPAMDADGSTPMVYMQGGVNTVRVIVRYLDHKKEMTYFLSDFAGSPHNFVNVGPNPVCGSAVDSSGRSPVYCLYYQDEGLKAFVFTVDTSSEENLIADLAVFESYQLAVINTGSLGQVIGDKLSSFEKRAAAVLPTKESHISLIIPGGSKKTFLFNANGNTITENTVEADVEFGPSVLYATKADERDRANLGCA